VDSLFFATKDYRVHKHSFVSMWAILHCISNNIVVPICWHLISSFKSVNKMNTNKYPRNYSHIQSISCSSLWAVSQNIKDYPLPAQTSLIHKIINPVSQSINNVLINNILINNVLINMAFKRCDPFLREHFQILKAATVGTTTLK